MAVRFTARENLHGEPSCSGAVPFQADRRTLYLVNDYMTRCVHRFKKRGARGRPFELAKTSNQGFGAMSSPSASASTVVPFNSV
jgi:hypothetical protein